MPSPTNPTRSTLHEFHPTLSLGRLNCEGPHETLALQISTGFGHRKPRARSLGSGTDCLATPLCVLDGRPCPLTRDLSFCQAAISTQPPLVAFGNAPSFFLLFWVLAPAHPSYLPLYYAHWALYFGKLSFDETFLQLSNLNVAPCSPPGP